MIRAELTDDGGVELTGDLGDRVVPGLRDRRLPLSWAACLMLRGIFEGDLEIGPQLEAWAAEERARRVDPATEAREQSDGPEFKVHEGERGEYHRELKQIDAETKWWRDIWRGMPEWIQTENPTWKDIKVLFRGPDEFDMFRRLLGLSDRVTRNAASFWFPEEAPIDMTQWRIVDEATPTEDYPPVARPPLRGRKEPKEKVTAGARKRTTAKKQTAHPFITKSTKKRLGG